jgi:hypothetical protein
VFRPRRRESAMIGTTTDTLNDPVAQQLLTSKIPARLAYCWTDGTPRVVPILFHWTGEEIVMATPSRAPKLRALHNGASVAVTIDSNEFPYKVLQIRGKIRLDPVSGVVPEYAAAARRYLGEEGGAAWIAQLPTDMRMWRISVSPEEVRILDFVTRFPSALSS